MTAGPGRNSWSVNEKSSTTSSRTRSSITLSSAFDDASAREALPQTANGEQANAETHKKKQKTNIDLTQTPRPVNSDDTV